MVSTEDSPAVIKTIRKTIKSQYGGLTTDRVVPFLNMLIELDCLWKNKNP